MDHPLLSGRFSVQTGCIDHQPVWQITASPITSASEPEAVGGESLSTWLSLWKLLNNTNTSTLYVRPWRDRQHNRLQAILCQNNPFSDNSGMKCQSIFIDLPLNHEQPWLLPELAKKEAVSPHGQTALDSTYLKLVSQAIQCLSLSGEKKTHACSDNRWLYRLSDQEWLYQTGIPEPQVKPGPVLITGHYFNLWSLEAVSPGKDAHPTWSKSSLFIARNDRHRKYHLWGAGDPVLIMEFSDTPYNVQDRYFGLDKPDIGTLIESQYLNLANLILNTVPNTPFNLYQWHGAMLGFRPVPLSKSLGDRVREQILRNPQSLYEFARQRPELHSTIKNYLETELPEHPLNAFFSNQAPPSSVSLTTNKQPSSHNPNLQPTNPHLSSSLFPVPIHTASDTHPNNQASLPEQSSVAPVQNKKNSDNIKRQSDLRKKKEKDEDDKRPPTATGLPRLESNPLSPTLLDHLVYLYRKYHLEPETFEPLPDFVGSVPGIQSTESFNPKNPLNMKQAAAALGSSLQVIIPISLERYLCYASDLQKTLNPQPMDRIEARNIIFLHDDKAMKLSYFTSGSRVFPWLSGFLDSSQLDPKETIWPASNRQKNAFWQLFPEWRQHVLLCRESLGCHSIASASDVLQQALTAPEELMKGEYWRNLFELYSELGLVCYPFDETEGANGAEFFISKNTIGAVIFFWKDSAQRYAPVLYPELQASDISAQIQELIRYLTNYSTGALLIEERLFAYVVPALLTLAPVVKKTHETVNRILKTKKALVYGGKSLHKHISSRIAPGDFTKTPVTNDIDLAIDDSELPEEFSAPLEQQLKSDLPGTLVISTNLGLKVINDHTEAVTTEKIIIYLYQGRDFSTKEDWRIFSMDISSATEGHFDFNRVEPYQPDSWLIIPTLTATVERLLQDLQSLQSYTGRDKERREKSTHKALKILLAYDSDQQVETIIHNTLSRETLAFSELPEFLHPFTKPLSDNDVVLPEESENSVVAMTVHETNKADNKPEDSDSGAEIDISEQDSASFSTIDSTTPVRVEPSTKDAEVQTTSEESLPSPVQSPAVQSQTIRAETAEALPSTESDKSTKKKKKKKKKKTTARQSTPTTADAETVEQPPEDMPQQPQTSQPQTIQPQTIQPQTIHAEATAHLPSTENDKSVKKSNKKKTAAQQPTPPAIDQKAAELQSEELSFWLEDMDKKFLDALTLTAQTPSCEFPEKPSLSTEPDVSRMRLQTGLITTAQILICSGTRVDITGSRPEITMNLATELNEKQRGALKEAALENHFPYAKLIQALLTLNQKHSEKDLKSTLAIYDNAFNLLLPAALAGIPLAYQLLLGLQLDLHHPAGWPQIESVNRLLRSWAARESSSTHITIEGLVDGGFLERLLKDNDVANLMLIEQGIDKESDLSGRGREVYAILKALREPDTQKAKKLKEVRPTFPELLQSISLLRLLLGKHQEPAPKQLNTELWRHSLTSLKLGSTSKKSTSKKKSSYSNLLLDAPGVLAMSDLTALKGAASTGVLLKGHQGNAIQFEHTGLWERYHALSQNDDKDAVKDSFMALFNEIGANAVEKARPDLIRDWTLARSFLLSRASSLVSGALSENVEQLAELKKHFDKATRKMIEQSIELEEAINKFDKTDIPDNAKVTEKTPPKTKQKTDIKPLAPPTDKNQQFLNLINHLDISLVQAIKSIQDTHLSYKQYEGLAELYSQLQQESEGITNIFQSGYYYFMAALCLLDARMSDDDKVIKLTINPAAHSNNQKIASLLNSAEIHNFPYALLLRFLFAYRMTGNHGGIILTGFQSAMAGVSQGVELLMKPSVGSATLAGLALKWLVRLPDRFQLKISIDIEPGSNADNRELTDLDIDMNMDKYTSGSLLLREFFEQLPDKGPDGALDSIINRIGTGLTDSPHLTDTPPEQTVIRAIRAEGAMRIMLCIATGRKEVLGSEDQRLSPELKVFQYLMSEPGAVEAQAEELRKRAENVNDLTPDEHGLMTDITELVLYITGVSASVPTLAYYNTLDLSRKDRLIAGLFGNKPPLMKKARQLLPELQINDDVTQQYLAVLTQLYLQLQAGENTKKIRQFLKTFVRHRDKLDLFHIRILNKMWNKRPDLLGKAGLRTTAPYDHMPAAFNIDSLKGFAKGQDVYLINAIQHAGETGYQQLVALLSLYEGKFDPESLLMSGWLNCLAGLNLLKPEIQSEHSVVFTMSTEALLAQAHAHFVKAREAGFPYSGYLDALILMRLNNRYQFSNKQSFKKSRTVIPELIIEQASTRKEGEQIFIQAGNILVDILPAVMESALLNVRSAADILIRIFTSESFNLLHTPQAGWPAEIVKWLLIAPETHNIHFSFRNKGAEVEEALFSGNSHTDSFEEILLKPLDELRQEPSIEKRLEDYDSLLRQQIYASEKSDSIKKYLRLIRAFMLKHPAALDTENADSSDADRLLTNILAVDISRADYSDRVMHVLSVMPQLATYFDEYTCNLPFFLKPKDDFRKNALLAVHRVRSTLIHYYFWAYEVLTGSPDNESDYFWEKIVPEIETMKGSFMALLATGDLTAMHKKERQGMKKSFQMYRHDINPWLGYFQTVSWLTNWRLGKEKQLRIHRGKLENLKIDHDLRSRLQPLQLWHEHWSSQNHQNP
ncbi:hypothetical protein NX722_27140 [Endozoicomonas gorgoniicola]|uniref:Uncharacterized protein n=1 Tax=Endozoicomonas gorgoniicola TaxID=1234144 RepID=A0ABT3N3P8_9GAMM|nr:hypothetical protein [Endozoicomonas gorgoniicola]MCW7556239.1 hypothetical protein [Endozoicomonas gorgoniicola]